MIPKKIYSHVAVILIAVVVLLVSGYYIFIRNYNNISDEPNRMSVQIKDVDGQLIDVREPDEYAADHANGAINIPLGNILNGDFSKIDINRPVYVYCRTGNRAGQAKTALEGAGYQNVTNLGGLSDWQNQGESTCKSTEPNC